MSEWRNVLSFNHFHKGLFPKSHGCQQDLINYCSLTVLVCLFHLKYHLCVFMYFVFLYLYFWLAIIPGPCCWHRLGQPSPTQITMAAMNDLLDRPYNLASHDKSLWWHPSKYQPMHCHQWWRWGSLHKTSICFLETWIIPPKTITRIIQRNNGVENLLKLAMSVKCLSDTFILCHACKWK